MTLLDTTHSDWDSFEGMGWDVWHGLVTSSVCIPRETPSSPCIEVHLSHQIGLHPLDKSIACDDGFFACLQPHARLKATFESTLLGVGFLERDDCRLFERFLQRLNWHDSGLEPKINAVPLAWVAKWLDASSLARLALASTSWKQCCGRREFWRLLCIHAGIQEARLVGCDLWGLFRFNAGRRSVASPLQSLLASHVLGETGTGKRVMFEVCVYNACEGGHQWREIFRKRSRASTLISEGLAFSFDLPEDGMQELQQEWKSGKLVHVEACGRQFCLSHRIRTEVTALLPGGKVKLFDAVGYDAEDDGESAGDGCVLVRELDVRGPTRQEEGCRLALFHQLAVWWKLGGDVGPERLGEADPRPGDAMAPVLHAVEMVVYFPEEDDVVSVDSGSWTCAASEEEGGSLSSS